ncbi:MAG: AarF/UbiB family protein [Bacteroidota bacterium]
MKQIARLLFACLPWAAFMPCNGSTTEPNYSKKLLKILKIEDKDTFDKEYNASKKILDEARERLVTTIFNVESSLIDTEKEIDKIKKILKQKSLFKEWLDTLTEPEAFEKESVVNRSKIDIFNYIFCLSSYTLEGQFNLTESFKKTVKTLTKEQRKNIILDFLSQEGLNEEKFPYSLAQNQEMFWIKSLIKNSPPITRKIFQKAEPFLSEINYQRIAIGTIHSLQEIRATKRIWKEALSVEPTITEEDKERVKALLGNSSEIQEIELLAEASIAVVYKVKADNKFYAVKVLKKDTKKEIEKNIASYLKLDIPEREKALLKELQQKALEETKLSEERKNIQQGQQVYQGAEGVYVVRLAEIDKEITQKDQALAMDSIEGQTLIDYLNKMAERIKKTRIEKLLPEERQKRFMSVYYGISPEMENEIRKVKKYIENLTLLFFNKLYCGKENFFHADLHTGNVLIHNQTKELYLLDFGFVGRSLKDKKYKVDRSFDKYYNKDEVTLKEVLYELKKLFDKWHKNRKFTKKSFVLEMVQNIAYCISPVLKNTKKGDGKPFHTQEELKSNPKLQTILDFWIKWRLKEISATGEDKIIEAEENLYRDINDAVKEVVDPDFQLAYTALKYIDDIRKKFNKQVYMSDIDHEQDALYINRPSLKEIESWKPQDTGDSKPQDTGDSKPQEPSSKGEISPKMLWLLYVSVPVIAVIIILVAFAKKKSSQHSRNSREETF